MKLIEIMELRDKLKAELVVVEKFLEIAKNHGVNGVVQTTPLASERTIPPQPNPNQTSLNIAGADRGYGGISETVREGIQICPNQYTVRDVERALEKLGKPLTILQITTALTRFANRTREIHIVTRGKGSKPTIYSRPTNFND